MKSSSIMLNFVMKLILILFVAPDQNVMGKLNKRVKGMLMDFDYLVSQLYLQQCTFVEIGEGVCSLFVELPLDTSKQCKRSLTKQIYFGNCLCSEFTKWQLCSRQLAMQRPEDCEFEEGVSCPSSSARVHRRLCDVTGMSQWNQQCNCSSSLAGAAQEPMCGFRTCYASPLPESVCTPRTVCGTAHCDVSLHGALYSVKCDPRCKDHQAFCERPGPSTTAKRSITSEWSSWQAINCDDKSNIQQYEAECFDEDHKPALDCLGPGLYCCSQDESDCICEVKQEDGHLKAFRYSITFSRLSKPDHSALKVRSAGMKAKAEVWHRLLDMADKDIDFSNETSSLFNIHRRIKTKPHRDEKLISIVGFSPSVGIQANYKQMGNQKNISGIESNNNSNINQSFLLNTQTNATNEISNILNTDLKKSPKKQNPTINDVIFAINSSNQNANGNLNMPSQQKEDNELLKKSKSDYRFTYKPNYNTDTNATSEEDGKSKTIVLSDTDANGKEDNINKHFKFNTIVNSTASDETNDNKNNQIDNHEKEDIKLDNTNLQSSDKDNSKQINDQTVLSEDKPKQNMEKSQMENLQSDQQKVLESSNKKNNNDQRPTSEVISSSNKSLKSGVQNELPNLNLKIKQKDVSSSNKQSVNAIIPKHAARQENTNPKVGEQHKNTKSVEHPIKSSNHINPHIKYNNSNQEKLSQILKKKFNDNKKDFNMQVNKFNQKSDLGTSTKNKDSVMIKDATHSAVFISDIDNLLPNPTTEPLLQNVTTSSGKIVETNTKPSMIKNTTTQEAKSIEKSIKKLGKVEEIFSDQKDPVIANVNGGSLLPEIESNTKTQNGMYDEPEPVLKDLDKENIDDNLADSLNHLMGLKYSPNKTAWTEKTKKEIIAQVK